MHTALSNISLLPLSVSLSDLKNASFVHESSVLQMDTSPPVHFDLISVCPKLNIHLPSF